MSYTIEHKNKKIVLPDFNELPVGIVRKARKVDPDEQMWFILEGVLSEKDMEIIDGMTIKEFTEAMNAWTQGVALGESLQSSKS